MIFGGLQKSSSLDFPGVLCCVLFTRGCDLNCFYCHNRELISRAGSYLPEDDIWAFLEKRKGLLDGVVISGGEPTLHSDLHAILGRMHDMGYKTKLDTNGQRPGAVVSLWEAGLLNYVALDIKALPADYPSVTGKDAASAFKTAKALQWLGAYYELRTTLYPGFTMEQLKELLSYLPHVSAWRLNYFRPREIFRPQDEQRLMLPALSYAAIRDESEALLKLQPHLLF